MANVKTLLEDVDENYSAKELTEIIQYLERARKKAQKQEEEMRLQREKEEAERKAREAEEQKAAHIQEVTCMDLPLDWNNLFNSDERTRGVHVDSIPDALIHSLTTLGSVDIEFMSAITGEDYKTVISTLKGSIYQNPETWGECFYKGWETAEEYLSGNLMRKWKAAKAANEEYNGYFQDNLKAIERVLPPTVASKDIYVTLGSPWVPADVIDDFIIHLFGRPVSMDQIYCARLHKYVDIRRFSCNPENCYRYSVCPMKDAKNPNYIPNGYKTIHDEYTGTWEIPGKSRYGYSLGVKSVHGTDRMDGMHILENTLNMKNLVIKDEVPCSTNKSGKKNVINQKETLSVQEKQRQMISEFQKWVWQDPDRKERLEMIFENQYSCVRRRIFDGSFLNFPGIDPSVQLYPYQKNAVARILFSPNTLLAHEVGSGKTYIMIAAGQELRRMGLSKKNLYVVPNNIVGQWRDIFLKMYPDADLLLVTPKSFTPAKREKVLEDIRDGDHDGIIMAYSCFELIPLSREYYLDEINEKKKAIQKILDQKSKATGKLRRKKDSLNGAMDRLKEAIDDMYDNLYFDELGITRLFLDEAHNYKNVPIETQIDSVLGINPKGSQRCKDMMDKVHMVQKKNGGKGVVLATGTPITNSITDVYVIQKYLQDGELGLLDLQSFDGWVGMFAEKVTEFEVDVDTSQFRMATRFAKFHNLPELTSLLAGIADFHHMDSSAGLPQFDGHGDALISKTADFEAYLKQISARAESVRNRNVSRSVDNMLMITTDGRKAALDMRLVDPNAAFTYQSKVARCAENVADIYYRTLNEKSTQLIFCDTSTPKKSFNMYDEMKDCLVKLGIPSDQIAYIHDAESETLREALFKRVRSGEVRILIGSTFKLGLGVNVQERLIAVHHLDVPWRPADMTQREGRILRQGNTNEKVQIYRYITEGSFDAYSWQLLETKQRFINAILSGSMEERSMSDIEGTVLDYAEVKALAIGNPLIKKRFEIANELERLRTLQRKLVESNLQLEKELLQLPGSIERKKERIELCERDIAYVERWNLLNPPARGKEEKKAEVERRRVFREKLRKAVYGNLLEHREHSFGVYRGFEIVLPANMLREKPYVWLVKNGRYYVELGDTEIGNLIRIDHFLDSLEGFKAELQKKLKEQMEREVEIRQELARDSSYAEQIEICKQELDTIDRELEVDKK